jgi:hypothetical protein
MTNFRPTARLTGFLMPPSVDEWLPQTHLARLVVEVVDAPHPRVAHSTWLRRTEPWASLTRSNRR